MAVGARPLVRYVRVAVSPLEKYSTRIPGEIPLSRIKNIGQALSSNT